MNLSIVLSSSLQVMCLQGTINTGLSVAPAGKYAWVRPSVHVYSHFLGPSLSYGLQTLSTSVFRQLSAVVLTRVGLNAKPALRVSQLYPLTYRLISPLS